MQQAPEPDQPQAELSKTSDDSAKGDAIYGDTLPAGTVLQNRFRIIQLLSQEDNSLLYQAVDLLRCWSCQTVQSQPDLRFCEVCGAELAKQFVINLRATPAIDPAQLPDLQSEWFKEDEYVFIIEIPVQPAAAGNKLLRTRLISGFHSDSGQVREIDEDSLLSMHLDGLCEMANAPALGFFAVADGIGGHDAGEVASRVAVHTLAAQVMQRIFIAELGGQLSPIEELAEQLQAAIMEANQAILDLRETLADSNMGCTLTAALIRGTSAVITNIGDSRTYWMHEGKLSQITRDHSMAAKLVEQNLMRPDEIYAFEQKGVIYRSLGDNAALIVDTDILELSVGDRLMLCSDGLWDMVRDPFIEDVLLEQYDPQQASERLVELANLAGGEDNISVIVVDVHSPV
jgi:serine/threonine protein phosphatase PrpC